MVLLVPVLIWKAFIFGDGVNEHGLAISNQYDRGYASYANKIHDGYINISQTEY